jgi:hypothetical protein
MIVDREGTRVTVQLINKLGGTGPKGRPRQADGAVLYTHVGAEPPTDASGWTYAGTHTRTRIELAFPLHLPPGTPVCITAQWFNAHGNGPPASPITTVLVGGGIGLLGNRAA